MRYVVLGCLLTGGLFTGGLVTGCGPSAEARARAAHDDRYLAAMRTRDQGRLDAAYAALDPLTATADPELRALARRQQARIRADQGRPAEAIAIYDQVDGDPAQIARAALDRAALAPDRAARRAALLAVAEAHPATAAAEHALEQLAADATPTEAGPTADAFARLAAAHPDAIGPAALWWQAHVELYRLGDLPAARATLRALTRRHCCATETHDALRLLAAIYTRQGAWDHAITTWRSLAETHPDRGFFPPFGSARAIHADDAALAAGRVALHGKRAPAEAAELLRRALQDYPDARTADDARYHLATAEAAAGRPAEARAALAALAERHPHSRYAAATVETLPAPDPQSLTDLFP